MLHNMICFQYCIGYFFLCFLSSSWHVSMTVLHTLFCVLLQNPMLDISSTSSECSDDETPLKLLNKQELDTKASEKRDEKSKKEHKHKKKSKKRDRKKSSNSESESDAADSRKDRHKKRKKKKKKNESANEKHKKHANSSKESHHKIRRSETTSRSGR